MSGRSAAALVLFVIATSAVIAFVFARPSEPEPATPRATVRPSAILRNQTPRVIQRTSKEEKPDASTDRTDGCGQEPATFGEVVISVPTSVLGEKAEIQVYVPRGYDSQKRHPLIIAFHDYPGGPWGVIRRSSLDELAEAEGVLIVAVRDDITDLNGVWDSTADAERAHHAMVRVGEQYCVDRARVFAYGHGAGGSGVEHIMCAFDDIAAAATTAYRPESTGAVRCRSVKPRLQIDPQDNPGTPADGQTPCGMLFHPMLSTEEYETELRGRAACRKPASTWLKHPGGTCTQWRCDTALVTCRVAGGRELAGTTPRQGLCARACDGEPGNFPHLNAIWRFFEESAPGEESK